jgi:hypothetical protein
MIEALESRFKIEECSFKTIFETLDGHRIHAGSKVAEKIESRPAIRSISTMWTSGRASATWLSMTYFPAGTEMSSGSRLTSMHP